ncbi:MAG: hypothetical protein NTX28_11360 [Novosphingobium sp.]|nr:hypothetical protein [Novosphingobium sp.]
MNTSFFKAALLSLPLFAQPVFAQEAASDTDSAQVAVTGSVARLCILGEPSRAVVNLGQMAQTSGAGVGRLAALSDQTVSLPGTFCNFAGSTLGVTASAIVGSATGAPPSGFANAVNYTATASGWGSEATIATTTAAADGSSPDASASGSVQPQPKLGTVDVALSSFTAPQNGLLVAGDYSGLVTVTLGPVQVSE